MDLDKFATAQLSSRTAEVQVPELAEFFAEGEAPVWTVRNLTAAEFGRCMEAGSERTKENVRALIAAFAGEGDKTEAVQRVAGIAPDEVPEDIARRLSELTIGSVNPALGEGKRDLAIRLADKFPNVFFRLTKKIRDLTDQGAELGK